MYRLKTTNSYKKNLKLAIKRGCKYSDLEFVVKWLSETDNPLPEIYKDHKLKGKYKDCRECHIYSDWLLVYQKIRETLVLLLIDTGTHSDLFKK